MRRPPLTSAQIKLLEALTEGVRLKIRVDRRGRVGDFLVIERNRTVAVITRRTMAAICGIGNTWKSQPQKVARADKPIPPKPATKVARDEVPDRDAQLLDDVARGMAGRPFARLAAVDQEAVRGIVARLEAAEATKAR
jgi:hypothetical protein